MVYLCLIWSSFSGSLMMTWTPIFILVFCRLKSRQAILAFVIRLTIPLNSKEMDERLKTTQLHNPVKTFTDSRLCCCLATKEATPS